MATYRGFKLHRAAFAFAGVYAAAPLFAASATTPSLMWAGSRQLAVHCLVQSRTVADAAKTEAALCERVRALATRRTRLPVRVVQPGDPAFIKSDTVLLLVQVSIERRADGQMLALAMRPYRPSGGDAEVYFGASPRALLMQQGLMRSALGPALDRELEAALSEILPAQQPTEPSARRL
jgi:hypothetical protein